jgi:hypothetical protein
VRLGAAGLLGVAAAASSSGHLVVSGILAAVIVGLAQQSLP